MSQSGAPPPGSPVESIQPEVTLGRTFDIEQAQEEARQHLAYGFTGIFLLTILLGFGTLWIRPSMWSDTKDLFELLLAAEAGILGTVLGFYFAARR